MSRLASIAPPNPWALWGGPLWRAAVSCVAITVLCGVWSFASNRQADSPERFFPAFEAAVFAPPSQAHTLRFIMLRHGITHFNRRDHRLQLWNRALHTRMEI